MLRSATPSSSPVNETGTPHFVVVPFCTLMSHARSDLSPLESGGDDGARTRDLCRDRTKTNRNPLILKRTNGSESAQMASKTPFSTLIEPSETQESRGQSIKPGGYNGNDFMPIHRNAVTRAILDR